MLPYNDIDDEYDDSDDEYDDIDDEDDNSDDEYDDVNSDDEDIEDIYEEYEHDEDNDGQQGDDGVLVRCSTLRFWSGGLKQVSDPGFANVKGLNYVSEHCKVMFSLSPYDE
ncbi:hypothetical protein scyTo_0015326 [Scyliorhinus torazame]|uniref:Uncharacterized protein n=1 Tax=Scyliorhinus torazame TaxID=75743 RepID=A0A401PQR3_SCYTO|nr:hypothetical protein [Scyliorhinus torazame]